MKEERMAVGYVSDDVCFQRVSKDCFLKQGGTEQQQTGDSVFVHAHTPSARLKALSSLTFSHAFSAALVLLGVSVLLSLPAFR